MNIVKYTLDFFNNWNYEEKKDKLKPQWSTFDKMVTSISSHYQRKYKEFQNLRKKWDTKLKLYGGDTSNFDWYQFRPLRLDREEDWSDWLAYLISESQTGYFSSYLFNIQGINSEEYYIPLNVYREFLYKGYRADIIIEWKNKIYTHIEIKVGDKNLAKTYKTANLMRKYFHVSEDKWHNFIIILEEQSESWLSLFSDVEETILSILWNDVAIAIRKSLLYSNEPLAWKVWAYSYLGAIEQKLLNFKKDYKISDLLKINKNIMIFKEGISNG